MDIEYTDERRAAEWGLASMVLGAVLVLLGPPTLLLEHVLESSDFRGMTRLEIRLAGIGGVMAAIILLVSAVMGFVFGIWSMGAAQRTEAPPARGLVGILLCGLAVFIWLSAGGAWVGSIWWRI
jgi:hypothetical protein